MGRPFNLTLSASTKFLRVGEIPALTAKAIYPESEDNSEAQDFARAGCQINHEEALSKAIKSGMVTPLNPLSYEQHTLPFGDALRRAIISLDDFKRFAESLQIEVVIWDEPLPAQDTNDVAGTKTHLTIREAASALAEKYGFNENTTNTMRAQLNEAAERGDITVRHPHTLLPYIPNPRRDFYELVSVTDLNAWLKKNGADYQIDVVLTDNSHNPSLTIDDVICSKAGISIFDATEALAKKYGLDKPAKDALLERMMEAAHRGELIVRDKAFMPYKPSHAEVHFYMLERVSGGDLNVWFEKQGAEYRLDRPEQVAYVETAHMGRLINRNEVMAAFTVKPNREENRKFWDDKLSRPPEWLKAARINPGKPGTSALWNPLLIAHSLLAAGHMTLSKLDDVMNKCFSKLVEIWNEETSDKR